MSELGKCGHCSGMVFSNAAYVTCVCDRIYHEFCKSITVNYTDDQIIGCKFCLDEASVIANRNLRLRTECREKSNEKIDKLMKMVTDISIIVDCLPGIENTLKTQTAELNVLKQKFDTVANKLDAVITQTNENAVKIESLDSHVASLNSRLVNVEAIVNDATSSTFTGADRESLRRQVDFDVNRRFEIAIVGLPQALLLDIESTMTKLATILHISFYNWHLSLTRLLSSKSSSNKVLLVRFISPTFRNNWLKAKRIHGDLKCLDIDSALGSGKIYINQRETVAERRLLFEARKVVRDNKYHSCWSNEGKIMVKISESSKPIPYSTLLLEQSKVATHPDAMQVDPSANFLPPTRAKLD